MDRKRNDELIHTKIVTIQRERKMKELIITIAAFSLLCTSALAMEKCETEIPDLMKKLKAKEEILEQSKKTYISDL